MKKIIIFLLLIPFSFSFAIMPPYVYQKRSENSQIKALAYFVKKEKTDSNYFSTGYKGYFKPDHIFTGEVDGYITAGFTSVKPTKNMPVGGTIYYSPVENVLYYITVSSQGGMITSLTAVSENERELYIKNFDKIVYGIGDAWIGK